MLIDVSGPSLITIGSNCYRIHNLHSRLDDESTGFLSTNGKVYILNNISYEILLMLEGGNSQEEIINQLCQKYSVSSDTVSPDVEEFMNQLKKLDLL